MTQRIHNPDTAADIELREHLDSDARPCFAMVAGAGSGKTTSLVKALDHVGKRHGKQLRIRGQRVACITYTEIATAEIWGDVGNNPLFHVSTIHSFLWSLVSPFQPDISAWVKYRIEERIATKQQELDNCGPRTRQKTKDRLTAEIGHLSEQLRQIAGVPRYNYEGSGDYLKGLLAHDDIIKMASYLIASKPLLRKVFAQKYPFCFVDESQDTFPEVVDALQSVASAKPGGFCLGFFGDPMQKIYGHGAGDIKFDGSHVRIEKPENFRCPTKVLSVINRIRADGDKLQQEGGRMATVGSVRTPVEGQAKIFVLPADRNRTANLHAVRRWMAQHLSDPLWLDESSIGDVRILVIVHRIAAARLGFPDLYSAFNDGSSDSVVMGFREGTHWSLKIFLEFVLPLVSYHNNGEKFRVMSLLRDHCPRLEKNALKGRSSASELLTELKVAVAEMAELLADDGSASVLDVIRFVKKSGIAQIDERFNGWLQGAGNSLDDESVPHEVVDDPNSSPQGGPESWVCAYLACPAQQLWGYFHYLMENSPYSTQQGIKGAEFERVIVILDDEESAHHQYSYEKLLGLKGPSVTDRRNAQEGKETVFDRTRRLFYVCCSRATQDLVVVLYTSDVDSAVDRMRELAIFDYHDIHTLECMQETAF